MPQQVTRWFQAVAAIAGSVLLLNASQLFSAGDTGWQPWPADLVDSIGTDILGCAVLLAVAVAVSGGLLRGRFPVLVGSLLLGAATWVAAWFLYNGSEEGTTALLYGWGALVQTTALPLVAGAWALRWRIPRSGTDLLSPEGVWDAPGGTLRCEPDGTFTLDRQGVTAVGSWEADAVGQAVLRVDGVTELGRGWQATVLTFERAPDGSARLRADTDTVYTRREAELVVQASGGFVGGLEMIES